MYNIMHIPLTVYCMYFTRPAIEVTKRPNYINGNVQCILSLLKPFTMHDKAKNLPPPPPTTTSKNNKTTIILYILEGIISNILRANSLGLFTRLYV